MGLSRLRPMRSRPFSKLETGSSIQPSTASATISASMALSAFFERSEDLRSYGEIRKRRTGRGNGGFLTPTFSKAKPTL